VFPPIPSGSPVPAEVLAFFIEDDAALDGRVFGAGVEDEPPELARADDDDAALGDLLDRSCCFQADEVVVGGEFLHCCVILPALRTKPRRPVAIRIMAVRNG